MGLSRVPEERENPNREKSILMAPRRVRPLHNFDLPGLKWGTQKTLRCARLNDSPTAAVNVTVADHRRRSPAPGFEPRLLNSWRESGKSPIPDDDFGDGVGIEDVRKKLMQDLKTEADKLKDAMLRGDEKVKGTVAVADNDAVPPAAVVAAEERPWKLRKRRPAGEGSPAKFHEDGVGAGGVEKKVKFSESLTKQEIEEDFMKILGTKPPRRPKKRPRNVQKQLNRLFPELPEVTLEKYMVHEDRENRKKEKWNYRSG